MYDGRCTFRQYKLAWLLFFVTAKHCHSFLELRPDGMNRWFGRDTHLIFQNSQLHGIRGFRIWFETQFPESIVSINADASEDTFDHVLLDMNHMIHMVLRRSRSEEHAIRLLMSELDAVLKMVVPTKSLVLAIDGAPPAAKLATQRSRRYGTLVRTKWKLDHFDKLRISKKQRARKLRSYHSEIESLCITPGTEFQDLMETTLLYWAWQRLQHRHGKLRDVRIFLSPSTVPGEGEVKLLEWILQKPRQGQSVAILGGDSDLLLEGLIIPPYWTHNVFVIQADSNRRYFSVSLWETTRKLQSWVPSNAPPEQILQLRTDLVFLMMLNGNDYLPKLRRSRGVSHLCQVYQQLVREEYSISHRGKDDQNKESKDTVGLLDPDTLEFHTDFCIRFFEEISKTMKANNTWMEVSTDRQQSPLSKLNNLIDGGFIPQPSRFRVINGDQTSAVTEELDEGSDDSLEEADNDGEDTIDDIEDDEINVEESSNEILVRLTLGSPESEDFLQYELSQYASEPLRQAKQKLALMALDDFFGTDLASSDSEEDYDALMELTGITSRGYSWEIANAARPGKVEKYLGGLLWNIQTYQDGICADYNYSYGRLQSPDVNDIVAFFKSAKAEGSSVSRQSLLGDKFSPAVSAGLSCLAALPAQVKNLVPEPYRWIPEETVEEFYGECMHKDDNVFDMKRFESLCEREIQRIRKDRGDSQQIDESTDSGRGRRILSGDHWWTVLGRTPEPLTHPFDPPPPPSEKFSELFPNPRVRVSRSFAISSPRPRAAWGNQPTKQRRQEEDSIRHLTFGKLLRRGKEKLLDLTYKVDYQKERQSSARNKKPEKSVDNILSTDTTDIMGRMEEFKKDMPPSEPVANVEGHTALYILTQLHAMEMVGPIEFNITVPSKSEYASWNAERYENYHLRIRPSDMGSVNVLNTTLEFDQDRDMTRQSRQALKQHLADLALSKLVGSDVQWRNLTFADLRWVLQKNLSSSQVNGVHDMNMSRRRNGQTPLQNEPNDHAGEECPIPVRNREGQSAIECLKQLSDINLIGSINLFEKPSSPPTLEKVVLVVAPGRASLSLLDEELSLEEDRVRISRKTSRQRLASLALSSLAGREMDWSKVAFADLKSFLLKKATGIAKKEKK